MRRATYAACLLADPGLQEPIYLGKPNLTDTVGAFLIRLANSRDSVP